MIRWRPPDGSDLAAPSAALALLEQAIAARPENGLLRLKLAHLLLDRYQFTAAASAFESALALDPGSARAIRGLARCYNALGRHDEALELLPGREPPEYERAVALAAFGREAEAERELRALLATNPSHGPACRRLGKILRLEGRTAELLEMCEALDARGAAHAQLFYIWGTALALAGRDEEARALLFDRGRVTELALPAPDGFDDIAAFNAALAEEILANPHRISDFPAKAEANRGSSRVHALFAGRRPELVRKLLGSLQALVEAQAPPSRGAFDPWSRARPERARLKAWGLIQRGGDFEEWHSHSGGWMSGVYYVQVPGCVTAKDAGPGCIEFGPPPALDRDRPGHVPVWRHAPREGHVLLAPSHYPHRTIPTGAAELRISFAFDVVADS